MSTQWKGSVNVAAPAEQVYEFLADFSRHPEWDASTERIEQTEPGDANGLGAKWKAYECLDALKSDRDRKPILDLAGNVGMAMREVRELVPGRTVAWHSYPVPRMGVTADYRFDIEATPDGSNVTYSVQMNVPSIMDALTKKVFRDMEAKQHAMWTQCLERVKESAMRSADLVAV